MEKTATLNLRINPELKKDAESVLGQLGIPMSTAIDMFLHQVVLVGGIPFTVTLPQAPESMDVSKMTAEQLIEEIQRGYDDYRNGQVQPAEAAFAGIREKLKL